MGQNTEHEYGAISDVVSAGGDRARQEPEQRHIQPLLQLAHDAAHAVGNHLAPDLQQARERPTEPRPTQSAPQDSVRHDHPQPGDQRQRHERPAEIRTERCHRDRGQRSHATTRAVDGGGDGRAIHGDEGGAETLKQSIGELIAADQGNDEANLGGEREEGQYRDEDRAGNDGQNQTQRKDRTEPRSEVTRRAGHLSDREQVGAQLREHRHNAGQTHRERVGADPLRPELP